MGDPVVSKMGDQVFRIGGPFSRKGVTFLSCKLELCEDTFGAPLKDELRGVDRLKFRPALHSTYILL